MTTTPHDVDLERAAPSADPSTRSLVRAGTIAGAIAAVCTTVVAVIARASGVGLEVDRTPIPIPAFALWTAVGAGLGIVLARVLRQRRKFVVVTVVCAGLSLVPAIAVPDDAATAAVLVFAHLVAAAVVIPALGRRLPASAVAR